MDEIPTIVLVFLVLFTGTFMGAAFVLITHPSINQGMAAIEACEASLPRDKSCEVVITAKVRE